MVECTIQLSPVKDRKPGPIFEPADMPCGSLKAVKIIEKETYSGRMAIAILIELPDGTQVMAKTTARIIDGIAGAVRGACMMWGDFE